MISEFYFKKQIYLETEDFLCYNLRYRFLKGKPNMNDDKKETSLESLVPRTRGKSGCGTRLILDNSGKQSIPSVEAILFATNKGGGSSGAPLTAFE
jgi:hypothetical protein